MPPPAIDSAEIAVKKPITASLMGKIKSWIDYLNSSITPGAVGIPMNGSFDLDTDADGVPDNWTKSLYQNGASAIEITSPAHGAKAFKFTRTAGAGNGGGYLESDYIEIAEIVGYVLGFLHWASAAGMKNMVVIRFFDKAKVDLTSDQTIYSSTANPTSAVYFLRAFTPPANARYIKIKLIGGYTDTDVAGSAYFDGLTLLAGSAITPAAPATIPIAANSTALASYVDLNQSSVFVPHGARRLVANLALKVVGSTTAYVRLKIGSTYSSEIGSTQTTYAAGEVSMDIPASLWGSFQTVTMQGKVATAGGGNTCWGSKANGDMAAIEQQSYIDFTY